MTEERFLRRRDVIAMTGLSKSQIDRLTRAGKFPGRISISSGCSAWVNSQVQAWIADRILASSKKVTLGNAKRSIATRRNAAAIDGKPA